MENQKKMVQAPTRNKQKKSEKIRNMDKTWAQNLSLRLELGLCREFDDLWQDLHGAIGSPQVTRLELRRGGDHWISNKSYDSYATIRDLDEIYGNV